VFEFAAMWASTSAPAGEDRTRPEVVFLAVEPNRDAVEFLRARFGDGVTVYQVTTGIRQGRWIPDRPVDVSFINGCFTASIRFASARC